MMRWLVVVLLFAMPMNGQHTVPSTAGVLVAVGDGSVLVRNDGHTRRLVVNRETKIWRGQDVGLGQLRVGDQLDITYRIASGGQEVATQIWANIDRWDGKVIRVTGDSAEIAIIGEHEERLGMATVMFDGRTVFNEGSRQDVRVGRELEVVGLVLDKHRMQATRVLHILE